MSRKALKAPYVYFGGKAQIAPVVWKRLGDVEYYIEPFFGSGAVLLARPYSKYIGSIGHEIVNDMDGMVSNFWRAAAKDPEKVAHYADYPVLEPDLHARHGYLVKRRKGLTAKLMGDKDYYNAKLAGYWVWGMGAWIGGGFCSGKGPWVQVDGKLVRADRGNSTNGVNRKIPHLTGGHGINRQLPHLTGGHGVNVTVRSKGSGIEAAHTKYLIGVMSQLRDRMRAVIVACGDWKRLVKQVARNVDSGASTAVFLDPPYEEGDWTHDGYNATCVFSEVMEWALEIGKAPNARVAFCGYMADNQKPPKGWSVVRWKAAGGYGNQGESRGKENARKETIWFRPGCDEAVRQKSMHPLFGG